MFAVKFAGEFRATPSWYTIGLVMTRSTPSLARAEMLKWARQACAMPAEKVAVRLGFDESRLHAWEAGEGAPSIAQLRKLGELYKRPLAFFYLPRPPEEPDMIVEYRNKSKHQERAPELYHELRSAHARRCLAMEIAEKLQEPAREFRSFISSDEDAEIAGRRLRSDLGVSLEEQIASDNRDDYRSLRMWRTAVENCGVLVFQMKGVATGLTRGFSIPGNVFPVIALNPNDALNGRVFTLLHEYVHLALHSGGLCGDASGIEAFCDRVAGCVLLPREPLLKSLAAVGTLDAAAVGRLARQYGVSEFALVTRLWSLGRVSQREYEEHAARLRLRRGSAERESSGGPSHYRVQVSRLGRPFISLVVHAFERDALSQRDMGAALNIRVSHLEKLLENM